jgi:tetratricopeptide (TPR) repeat protein
MFQGGMKQKLRELLKAGRDKEASDLLPHVTDAPPDPPGRWTAKDQLAHLAMWRQYAADEIDAVRTGEPGPIASNDDDIENAKTYEKTHREPAASIRQSGMSSWDRLTAAVEACSDADLAKPRLRRANQALWQNVPNNTYYHLAEHLAYWHIDEGDEAAAEAAAKWGHDLAISTFPDDRTRGVAAYNLGCFYAKRCQAAAAVPQLRKAIELRPDLREVARQDRDLDPIRSTPGLTALLG